MTPTGEHVLCLPAVVGPAARWPDLDPESGEMARFSEFEGQMGRSSEGVLEVHRM